MKIREALPERSVIVVVEFVNENGMTVRVVERHSKMMESVILNLDYLVVIPNQKRYVFFVRDLEDNDDGN